MNLDSVMPGLVPGIHVFGSRSPASDVDGRARPGHDEHASVVHEHPL